MALSDDLAARLAKSQAEMRAASERQQSLADKPEGATLASLEFPDPRKAVEAELKRKGLTDEQVKAETARILKGFPEAPAALEQAQRIRRAAEAEPREDAKRELVEAAERAEAKVIGITERSLAEAQKARADELKALATPETEREKGIREASETLESALKETRGDLGAAIRRGLVTEAEAERASLSGRFTRDGKSLSRADVTAAGKAEGVRILTEQKATRQTKTLAKIADAKVDGGYDLVKALDKATVAQLIDAGFDEGAVVGANETRKLSRTFRRAEAKALAAEVGTMQTVARLAQQGKPAEAAELAAKLRADYQAKVGPLSERLARSGAAAKQFFTQYEPVDGRLPTLPGIIPFGWVPTALKKEMSLGEIALNSAMDALILVPVGKVAKPLSAAGKAATTRAIRPVTAVLKAADNVPSLRKAATLTTRVARATAAGDDATVRSLGRQLAKLGEAAKAESLVTRGNALAKYGIFTSRAVPTPVLSTGPTLRETIASTKAAASTARRALALEQGQVAIRKVAAQAGLSKDPIYTQVRDEIKTAIKAVKESIPSARAAATSAQRDAALLRGRLAMERISRTLADAPKTTGWAQVRAEWTSAARQLQRQVKAATEPVLGAMTTAKRAAALERGLVEIQRTARNAGVTRQPIYREVASELRDAIRAIKMAANTTPGAVAAARRAAALERGQVAIARIEQQLRAAPSTTPWDELRAAWRATVRGVRGAPASAREAIRIASGKPLPKAPTPWQLRRLKQWDDILDDIVQGREVRPVVKRTPPRTPSAPKEPPPEPPTRGGTAVAERISEAKPGSTIPVKPVVSKSGKITNAIARGAAGATVRLYQQAEQNGVVSDTEASNIGKAVSTQYPNIRPADVERVVVDIKQGRVELAPSAISDIFIERNPNRITIGGKTFTITPSRVADFIARSSPVTVGGVSVQASTGAGPATGAEPATRGEVSTKTDVQARRAEETRLRSRISLAGGERRVPFTIDLPGRPITALPAGRYPRVVAWKQGLVEWTVDLDTGSRTTRAVRTPGRPARTFRVIRTDATPPSARKLRMGIVDLNIEPGGLKFSARQKAARRTASRMFRRR